MGDRAHLEKVHPTSTKRRKKGESVRRNPANNANVAPAGWQDIKEDVAKLHEEWKQWAEWVREDLLVLEGRTGLSLAPPPPPEDPW